MANRSTTVERAGTPNGGKHDRKLRNNENNEQFTELTYSQVVCGVIFFLTFVIVCIAQHLHV